MRHVFHIPTLEVNIKNKKKDETNLISMKFNFQQFVEFYLLLFLCDLTEASRSEQKRSEPRFSFVVVVEPGFDRFDLVFKKKR